MKPPTLYYKDLDEPEKMPSLRSMPEGQNLISGYYLDWYNKGANSLGLFKGLSIDIKRPFSPIFVLSTQK